jgi:hypothetical protein
MAMTSVQKEDRKAARKAYSRVLANMKACEGQVHAQAVKDAVDYGCMAGMKASRIICDMAAAGICPDEAASALLHSPFAR